MAIIQFLQNVFDPRIFNYLVMSLYVMNIMWWALVQNNYGQAWYWASAASITASVTWGGWIK